MSGGASPAGTAPGPVVVAVPEDDDAAPLGLMHLRSWHETYVCPEHGIDAAWVDEHVGFLATPAADAFRRGTFAAQRADPAATFYRVARRGGDVVGLVHASASGSHGGSGGGSHEGGPVQLEGLYLLREVHGSGLADALLAEVLGWCGGRPVQLEVASCNTRAVRFYRRHGFRPTGRTGAFHGRVPTEELLRP